MVWVEKVREIIVGVEVRERIEVKVYKVIIRILVFGF